MAQNSRNSALDPLKVLGTTKLVVESAQFVTLDHNAVEKISRKIEKQLSAQLETAEQGYGATGNYDQDVQLIFMENAANFCFWAEKDEPKWQVGWKGKDRSGFYGLVASFQRALAENPHTLDADYMANINEASAEHIFRSNNATEIPLLKERTHNLREAGQVLKEKYEGHFKNVLESAHYDAIEIAKLLYQDFPSFHDVAQFDGNDVYFLKRAQITSYDMSHLSHPEKRKMSNLHALTAFADYKIPQMLREAGVIRYAEDLAQHVDEYVLITAGSREEIEIRSATIWGIELIRQKLKNYTAADIDKALWLASQDQTGLRPYHRTYSTYY